MTPDRWLDDAKDCDIPAVVNFARTPMIGIQAVRNAVIERWSNGQTEGQINRIKTLNRQMFGRANTELLGARLLPIGG
jgi:transposase